MPKAIQVHDSYLIAETGDGMMVIDQHALHERILYEELRNRVARGNVESQRLLVPEPVDLPAAEAALLIEQAELLGQLGLEVEPFGGDTVLVRSIPAMLRHVEPGPSGPRPGRAPAHAAPAADPRRRAWRAAAHGRLQGGRQGRPAALAAGDRGAAGARAPRGRLASLSARPADCACLHQGRSRKAVRADLNEAQCETGESCGLGINLFHGLAALSYNQPETNGSIGRVDEGEGRERLPVQGGVRR